MRLKNQSQQQFKFWQGFNPPVAVAHRGGDGAGIDKENSLKAFKAAYNLGYRWFETDLVATHDKKLLAIHGRGYQLRPNKDLPSRTKIRTMTHKKFMHEIKVGGEEVPLLDELLDEFPDIKFIIDPKTYRSVPALVECMSNRPNDVDRLCVGAFSKMRTIRVAYLIKKNTGKEVCTCILGPINAYPIYVAARIKILRPFAKYYVQETNAGSIHVPYRWIINSPKAGQKLIEYAHELGLKVAVYTPNSAKTIRASVSAGVDVVISDRVSLLKKIILNKQGNLA
jgi:glycerophosphoryl diester phosphodiesterase